VRKRQLKKFAKRAKLTRNIDAYRAAHKGGTKALRRRLKCMKRYAGPESPAIREMRTMMSSIKRSIRDWQRGWEDSRCVVDRLAELAPPEHVIERLVALAP